MEPDSPHAILKYRNLNLIRELKGEIPSPEVLQSWTVEREPDEVAFLLYEAILNSSENKKFIEAVRSQKLNSEKTHSSKSRLEIWIVSSGNQILSPWGAHVECMGRWLDEMNIDWNELVTLSDNNILQNAMLIGEAIQASHTKKLIISFGRGSLETSLLCKMNEKNKIYDLHSMSGWINIAGSVSGSTRSDLILKSPSLTLRAKIKSLFSREHFKNILLSSKTNPVWRSGSIGLVSLKNSVNVTVLPIAFERNIPAFYKTPYQQLKGFGPNDSQNLLADQLIRPGLIYPLWGQVVIDDVEVLKQTLLRVIFQVKNILDAKLGFDSLPEESIPEVSTKKTLTLELDHQFNR